jgi:tRNA(Ile)-lysidine synthase
MPANAVKTVSCAIDAALALARIRPSSVVAVGLSGGRDSMVLLDALASLAPARGISLVAVHVHHGLSRHADAWERFCEDACAARGIRLSVHRIGVDRASGNGLEAAARAARYDAFSTVDADYVALAHHAEDQAETVLLQLLRGAGPRGLSGMPPLRPGSSGPSLLRPLLLVPRAAIAAYAEARDVAWVEDESNADISLRRNFVRHEIAPRLAAIFPGYPLTVVRAAIHEAESAQLVDELAELDARDALAFDERLGDTLDRRAFSALAAAAPHRARNVLRWFLRRRGLRLPSTARLAAMQQQLAHASDDARVRISHDGVELGVHRGRIAVHAAAVPEFALKWQGESLLALPHGTLEFAPVSGAGLAAALLRQGPIMIRSRAGGERIRLAGNRPRQTVKRLLQGAGVPAWHRGGLPLVWCGDHLAAVPGIGVDAAFAAFADGPGYDVRWYPADPAAPSRGAAYGLVGDRAAGRAEVPTD